MQVYIMRHGEAENVVGQGHCDDSQRALTTQGETEATMMANWLEKMQIKPTQVFVSPYLRAQQTCALVTAMMQTTITTLDFITPAGDAKQVHDFIDGWFSEQASEQNSKQAQKNIHQSGHSEDVEQSVLFISHMPLVSYLVAQLTQTANTPIFTTAAIAHIDYDMDKMHGTLQRLMSPIELC